MVDKPAGLVVHPAAGHREGTLSQALAGRAAGGEAGRAGIVHRLDKDTSGLLVVARDEPTHGRCARRWPAASSSASTSRWSRAARRRGRGRSTRRSGATARHRTRMSAPTPTSRARP